MMVLVLLLRLNTCRVLNLSLGFWKYARTFTHVKKWCVMPTQGKRNWYWFTVELTRWIGGKWQMIVNFAWIFYCFLFHFLWVWAIKAIFSVSLPFMHTLLSVSNYEVFTKLKLGKVFCVLHFYTFRDKNILSLHKPHEHRKKGRDKKKYMKKA